MLSVVVSFSYRKLHDKCSQSGDGQSGNVCKHLKKIGTSRQYKITSGSAGCRKDKVGGGAGPRNVIENPLWNIEEEIKCLTNALKYRLFEVLAVSELSLFTHN